MFVKEDFFASDIHSAQRMLGPSPNRFDAGAGFGCRAIELRFLIVGFLELGFERRIDSPEFILKPRPRRLVGFLVFFGELLRRIGMASVRIDIRRLSTLG